MPLLIVIDIMIILLASARSALLKTSLAGLKRRGSIPTKRKQENSILLQSKASQHCHPISVLQKCWYEKLCAF